MRKLVLLLILVMVPVSLQAQQDPDWRNRRAHDRYDRRPDNQLELTLFGGYRENAYDSSWIFGDDIRVANSANFGAGLGIPLGNMMKLELSFDRQNSHLETTGGFFFPERVYLASFNSTMYQASLQIPFAYNRHVIPYAIVGAGVANMKVRVDGESESENHFAANAGVGVKLPISRNAGVRFEARGLYTSFGSDNCDCYDNTDRGLYQSETNFGVYFSF